ncbi:Phospholipid scramblase 1 [Orchesella cincta]|uniref:Phospholipid scramblase 1 n=1 Tax=Orchesella cincta TaxID=48709 RepID=A0A1D2MND3_ORCCI|nr:Phospholipid scramblase 1 [Orchesella cincta]
MSKNNDGGNKPKKSLSKQNSPRISRSGLANTILHPKNPSLATSNKGKVLKVPTTAATAAGYHLLYSNPSTPPQFRISDAESDPSSQKNGGDHIAILHQPLGAFHNSRGFGSDFNFRNNNSFVGGSSYSKALLHGSDTEISDSVRFLEGTHHLFFRHCKSFPPEISSFNPRNKRGIWNSSGRVVYYTGLKKCYVCKGCHYSGFEYEVVDYSGNTVIIATGKQFLLGLTSSATISLEGGRVLGTMYQSCLSSTYIIKDSTGRIVYKIQAPCFAPCAPFVFWCCKEHFEICLEDGVTEIGKITKYWGHDVDAPEFQSCLGIEMERADDVRVKALLLGCFFLIEFQYFRCGGNGPFFFIFMLLIFAGIALLAICYGNEFSEYCPLWPSSLEKKVKYLAKTNAFSQSHLSRLRELKNPTSSAMTSNYLLIFSLVAFMAYYSLASPYHRSFPYANSHDRSDGSSAIGFRGLKTPKRSFGPDPYTRNRKIDESYVLGNSGRREEQQRKRNQYDIINEARMAYSGAIDAPNGSNRREAQQEYEPELGLDYGLPSPPARRQPKQNPRWKKSGVPRHGAAIPHFEHRIPVDSEEAGDMADYQ